MLSLPARALRAVARRLDETPVRLALFALLALVAAWPLLETGDRLNWFRDAQVLLSYEHHAAETVRRFGQLPLWDPYYCGGFYALGSPQTRFTSPTFLLSVLFGAARAEALTSFLFLLVGLEGTWRYAKSYGGGALGSALAAPVFALSGCFVAAPFLGWTNFYGFELCPWAAWGVRRAVRGRSDGVVVAALAGAWIVGLGGTYAAPMTALVGAYEIALAAFRARRSRVDLARVAGMAALTALLAVGLAAVRLGPVAETLARAPRVLGGKPGAPLGNALAALMEAVQIRNGNVVGARMYVIGPFVLPALLAGLPRRRAWPLVAFAASALWAATGYATGWSPFVGLKALPVFSALRYPERYLILVALAAAVVAAVGVRTLEALARRRRAWSLGLLALVAALGATASYLVSDHHLVASKRMLLPAPPVLERDFHQTRGNRWNLAYYAPMSRGSLSCWDAYPVPMSPALRGDLPADEYLADASAGTAARTAWSPARIDVRVDLARPARLLVNQNYHPGWRASAGRVVDDGGLIAVDLPAGQCDVTLRFRPRSAIAGFASTLAALAALGWIALRARRRPGELGRRPLAWCAVAAAPLALGALAAAAIREPPMPPNPPRAPNGEPILVEAPPPASAPVGAAFANGVTLVAAGAAPADSVPAGGMLELDFRVDGAPRPETKVIVQAVSEAGERLRFDHLLLSAWTDLHSAPRGRLVRDLVPLPLRGGGAWRLEVGLATGAGADVAVTDPGQARPADGLLEVATLPAR
jgi:hypothetical protein